MLDELDTRQGVEPRPRPAHAVGTSTRRRPGRARRTGHWIAAILGWLALVVVVVWRLREASPWSLPLPLGVLLLAGAAGLVVLALLWARTVDRRRPQRPPIEAGD